MHSTSMFGSVGEVGSSSHNLAETFRWQGMHGTHQSSSGPMRTGYISAERFQPYSASSSNLSDHWNTEAGPPTLLPQQALHVAPSILRPTGGIIPETAADAEIRQTVTDEDEVPVSNFYPFAYSPCN